MIPFSWSWIPLAALLLTGTAAARDFAEAVPAQAVKPRMMAVAEARRSIPGSLLWEDRFDASVFEQAFSVATLRDRVFVAGFVFGPSGRDFVVRTYDAATGRLAWQDRHDGGSDGFASGVATDSERVFVSGTAFMAGHHYDWILRAYDPDTGELSWESTFDLAGRADFSRGTALAAGGGMVFLGGYGTNAQDVGDFNTDYVVRAHDAASGALVWQDQINGFSGAYSIAFENGRLFVGGWTDSDTALVRAYDATNGTLLWEQLTPGAPGFSQTWTRDIAVQDGKVIVAQPRRATTAPYEIAPLVQVYEAGSGALIWRDEFGTAGASVWLNEVAAFGGRVFAVGQGGTSCGFEPSNCDAVIRSYDASTGRIVWERQLELSGVDDIAELVIASRGTVFVLSQAAATFGLPGCCLIGRWVVQAFDGAGGQLLWQSVGGHLESGVYNMAVGRARLVIPGRGVDAQTGEWDLIVRAYDVSGRSGNIDRIFAAPRELFVAGPSGQISYEVTLDGTLGVAAHGAIPAEEQPGSVIDDPANDINTAFSTGIGIASHTLTVPPETRHLQVNLFDSETDGADDLDLYVFGPDGNFIGASASFTSTEQVTVERPAAGEYTVVVHGFQTDGPDANYTLFGWALGDAAAGNFDVSVAEPPTESSQLVTVSWSGLSVGRRYLGAVSYHDATNEIGQTIISFRP